MRSTLKIGGYAALAVAAVGSVVLVNYREGDGVLLGTLTALIAGLTYIRQHVIRCHRWYIHGYHAGYHAARHVDCFGSSCAILDLAQERVQQSVDIAGG